MRRAAAATCLLTLTVLTGCSAQQPNVDAKDLPLEYSTVDKTEPSLLGICRGKNLVERYGEVVVAKSFEHDNGDDAIDFVVVKSDDDQLWDRVVDEVTNCEPSHDASISEGVVLTMDWTVEPADGPEVGDDTLWFETTFTIANNVTGADTSTSRAVLARSGDYIVELTASALDDDEKTKLLRVAFGD